MASSWQIPRRVSCKLPGGGGVVRVPIVWWGMPYVQLHAFVLHRCNIREYEKPTLTPASRTPAAMPKNIPVYFGRYTFGFGTETKQSL